MNTATFFSYQQNVSLWFNKKQLAMTVLLISVLASAFAVIYLRDLNRRLFSEWEGLCQAKESLQIEDSQLLLEQNTWSTPARIEAIASQNLQMATPVSVRMVFT